METFTLKIPMRMIEDYEADCPNCGKPADRVYSQQRPIVFGGTPTHHGGDDR
jgi:hypothetical protein